MKLPEVIKFMRKEIGMTQVELAKALKVYSTSVSRWEAGKTTPQVKMLQNILALATERGCSEVCLKHLQAMVEAQHRELVKVSDSVLYPVERDSICQLVDAADYGVFIVDMETDELLYANAKAEEFMEQRFRPNSGQKCHEFVKNAFGLCIDYPKLQMKERGYTDVHIKHQHREQFFHVRGRLLKWNGRLAHVQYMTDETDALEAQGGLKDLLDNIDVGVCVWYMYKDGTLERSYSNAKYCEILGLDTNESRLYHDFANLKVIAPKDREVIRRKAFKAVKLERDFDFTVQLVAPKRACKWVNLHGRFMSKDKERIKYSCVLIDLDVLGK